MTLRPALEVLPETAFTWKQKYAYGQGGLGWHLLQIRAADATHWTDVVRFEQGDATAQWESVSVTAAVLGSWLHRAVRLRFIGEWRPRAGALAWPHGGFAIDELSVTGTLWEDVVWEEVGDLPANALEADVVPPDPGQWRYAVRAVGGERSNERRVRVVGAVAAVAGPPELDVLGWSKSSVTLQASSAGAVDIWVLRHALTPVISPEAATTEHPAGSGPLTLTGLQPGTHYWFEVRGQNASGPPGAASDVVTARTSGSPPGLPTTPTQAPGAEGVSLQPLLTWTAGLFATKSTLYLAEDPKAVSALLPYSALAAPWGSDFAVVEKLAPATKYSWRVVHHNEDGVTPGPVWTFTTTNDGTPPPAVTDLAVAAWSGTSVTLTWSAPGGDAASYDLRWAAAPLTPATWPLAMQVPTASPSAAGSVESVEVGGLSPDSTYWFGLRVSDPAGNESALPPAVSVITSPVPLPAAPASPEPPSGATGVDPGVSLMWENGAGAEVVRVYVAAHPADLPGAGPALGVVPPIATADGSLSTFSPAGGFVPGETVYWRVLAQNAGGTTAGPVWSFTTGAYAVAPPDPVTDLEVIEATHDTLTVRWTAPFGADSFQLRYDEAPITLENFFDAPAAASPPAGAGTAPLEATLGGLTADTTYHVAILSHRWQTRPPTTGAWPTATTLGGRWARSGRSRRVWR